MEKKSSTKEVHKLIQQDYPELYKKLCKILGQENPFAQFRIGAGVFIWSDNQYDWLPMVSATPTTQKRVMEALNSAKQMVLTKLGEKQTELLFTFPDDGYIYYNDEEGEMKVLITGWGFKKPVRLTPTPTTPIDINRKKETYIAFVFDGERIPNYPFGLSLTNQRRKLQTDESGVCNVGNLCAGKSYTIYDIQNNNKEYNIYITPEESYYEIDITRYTTLYVGASLDGAPLANEAVKVLYHGHTYDLVTSSDGTISINIPYYVGANLSATLREKTEALFVEADENHITFDLVSPPPIVETDVVVTVMHDSNPCPGCSVSIKYCSLTYSGVTDEQGQFIQHLQVAEGESCEVSVEEYTSQHRELADSPFNEFKFEKTTPLPPLPTRVTPTIVVQRANGEIVPEYPLSVETSDKTSDYLTDTEGKVILPDMAAGEVITLTDGKDSSHKETYTLASEQDCYIFTIPDEELVPAQQLKLMFRDKDGKPIECEGVIFKQDGIKDITSLLDKNGNMYLPADTFIVDKEITATIKGCKVSYAPIPFKTEEGEYEYLLQEKASKSSWLYLLLQICIILLSIMAVIILWPILEGIFVGTYEGIYGVRYPYSPF